MEKISIPMTNRIQVVACTVFVSILAGGGVFAQEFGDTILKTDGTQIPNVEVVREDLREVEFRQPSSDTPHTIVAAEVRHIERASAPTGIVRGYDLWRSGEFNRALAALEKVSGGGAWVSIYVGFYQADCLRHLGSPAEAERGASLFQRFLGDPEAAESRFAFDAVLGLGDCLLAAERVEEARAAYAGLAEDPRLGDLPDDAAEGYRLRARLGDAGCDAAAGELDDAISTAQRVASSARSTHADLSADAVLRGVIWRIESDRTEQVVREFQNQVVEASNGADVDAAQETENAVARVALALAATSAGDLAGAFDHLSRVLVFAHEFDAASAVALYGASRAQASLGAMHQEASTEAENADAQAGLTELAAEAKAQEKRYVNELRRRFPRSFWARRARFESR